MYQLNNSSNPPSLIISLRKTTIAISVFCPFPTGDQQRPQQQQQHHHIMSLTNTNTSTTTTSTSNQQQQPPPNQIPLPPPASHQQSIHHPHQNIQESSRHNKSDDDESSADEEDLDDDDDLDDDKPCDLRLLTPATCLREYKNSLVGQAVSYLASQQSSSIVPSHLQVDINNVSPVPIPAHIGGGGSQSLQHNASAALNQHPFSLAALYHSHHQQQHLGSTSSTLDPILKVEQAHHSLHQMPSVVAGGAFTCDRCGNSYARPHSLNRHKRFECGVEPKFECPVCHKKSKHKHNLVLHMRTHSQR